MEIIPNPNGANKTTSDTREQTCWDNYVESITNGRENAYKAAIDAGYEDSSAKKITVTRWFTERKAKLKRKDMLSKAERNLDKVLDFEMLTEEGKVNTPVASLVIGVSTTIASTLGKSEGYSTRNELTGADGKDLPIPILGNVQENNSNNENTEVN